jgi:hypothetical protein
MPKIVTGTVVRWDVDRTDPAKPTVVFKESQDVSTYVNDGLENVATAVMAQYILDVQALPGLGYQKLVQDAQSGLIEVLEVTSLSVEAPAVPPPIPAPAAKAPAAKAPAAKAPAAKGPAGKAGPGGVGK